MTFTPAILAVMVIFTIPYVLAVFAAFFVTVIWLADTMRFPARRCECGRVK
ncbi:MAG: hypothetical protein ACRCWF_05540 [Beijerinckiaceae bacterium]